MTKRFVRTCAVAAGFAACAAVSPSLAQEFYDASAAESRGRPGTIIRSEPFPGAPAGASAFKVLYRSTGLKGEPIAVSGLVVVPEGPVPEGGRRVVAWAHSTTGVARKCGPSLYPQALTWIPGLEHILARDFVVAATDYPGLGARGVHPYLYNIPLDGVVLERFMLAFERVAGICNDTLRQVMRLIMAEQPLEREGFLAVDVTKTEPWHNVMIENTPGNAPAGAPVFLAQGTSDPVVRPQVTAEFMRRLCEKGTPVRFVPVPGGDHDASAEVGAAPAVD